MSEMGAARSRQWKGALYRTCRTLHSYLSAFAFLTLIFFSLTGLLLNHPDWVGGLRPAVETTGRLPGADIAAAVAQPDAAAALAALAARQFPLVGTYASGDVEAGEAILHFKGVAGASDVIVSLEDGTAEIAIRRAGVAAMLNDLHRGKDAGRAWALLIDISAVLFFALSLVGYVLFFTLRLRLVACLKLTAAGAAVLGAAMWIAAG